MTFTHESIAGTKAYDNAYFSASRMSRCERTASKARPV